MNQPECYAKAAEAYHRAAQVEIEARGYLQDMIERLGMTAKEAQATNPYKRYVEAASCWTFAGNLYREEGAVGGPGTPDANE